MGFVRYSRRSLLGDEVEKINTKWFKYIHQDEVLYSPFFKKIKKYFVAGPGDRPPTPDEICAAISKDKNQEYDREGLCYKYDHHEPGTEVDYLPGGIYNHEGYDDSNNLPERLESFDLRSDKFLELGGMHSTVLDAINSFLSSEQIYRDTGCIYKTGILMYGPQGEGKSAVLRHVMKTAFPEDAIIMFCTRIPSDQFLRKMKETLPDRLKVFVFEEIVSMAGNDRQVERILTFLDGENSLDKSMSFATTNFPEKLPSNIVDRPGRFDDVIKFDHPKGNDVKKLAEFFLGREVTAEEVDSCKGASTAMIQQACIFSKRKKTTVSQALKEFKRRSELAKNDFAEQKRMGLIQDDDLYD